MTNKRVKTCLFIFFSSLLMSPLIFAQEKGFIKFDLNVDSVSIITNNDFNEARTISSKDSIELNAGNNLINLSVPFARVYERYTQIRPGITTEIYHEFVEEKLSFDVLEKNYAARRFYNKNIIFLTDSDSRISVNDSTIGTGFATFDQKSGSHSFTISNPDFGTSSIRYLSSNRQYISFVTMYKRPSESMAQIVSVVPGASQFYKKQFGKSAAFFAGTTLFTYAAISSNNSYQEELDIFNDLERQYNRTEDESIAFELGNQAERQQKEVQKLDNVRRVFFGLSILSYSLNILDAFKSIPDGGYRNERPIEFYLSSNNELTNGTSVSVRFNFGE